MQFGLIAAGCIGQLRAQALQKIPGAKLSAVTEIDQQRAAQVATSAHARVYKDVAELVGTDQGQPALTRAHRRITACSARNACRNRPGFPEGDTE